MRQVLVVWQATYVRPERCYLPDEIKKLPGFLHDWGVDESFWPRGTIKDRASSWRWARGDADGENLFMRYSGAEFRKKIMARLSVIIARQRVVDLCQRGQ